MSLLWLLAKKCDNSRLLQRSPHGAPSCLAFILRAQHRKAALLEHTGTQCNTDTVQHPLGSHNEHLCTLDTQWEWGAQPAGGQGSRDPQ
jgi:hypothetical protein